jgi:PPOX class probable F420-dependent enzyme
VVGVGGVEVSPTRYGGGAPVGGRIPASHLDLLECPPVAALTTVMPDGYPQTSVVWCDFDGTHVRINTMKGFQKERNMRRDPRVTVLCYDPREPLRYLEVRGAVVTMTEEGAASHLDDLASKYLGRQIRYFGDCIPLRFAESEIPVLCLVEPLHVVALDARAGRAAR